MANIYTSHRLINDDCLQIGNYLKPNSVHLIVTSPPYPMIEMWDYTFSEQSSSCIRRKDYNSAYHTMHHFLNQVWEEMDNYLIEGGFTCINVGDATRKGDRFQLYPNHSHIIEWFSTHGYDTLPPIIWRKTTNSPNKFMGSGMLPCGAYVTQEHEYILIFRKGKNRAFSSASEKQNRRESAYFYPERNLWFSDLWQLGGERQKLRHAERKRSAAYPFEIPYRLINMFSVYGDTVLDPFMGLGTTNAAAMSCGRNSVGFEVAKNICQMAQERMLEIKEPNSRLQWRMEQYKAFVYEETMKGRTFKYYNDNLGVNVVTKQEKDIKLFMVEHIESHGNMIFAQHRQI